MSSCVLCGVDIVKNTDKNLVDGRRGNSFKVREELLSLECKVEINSTYICRNCLCALKKRRALLNNLHEVNSSIQKIVQSKKCSAVPLPVPTPSSNQISDSQEQATMRVALEDFGASVTSVDIEEDNSTLPNRTSVDQWTSTLTSTPCKEKNRPVAFAAVVGPVSQLFCCFHVVARTAHRRRSELHRRSGTFRTRLEDLHIRLSFKKCF